MSLTTLSGAAGALRRSHPLEARTLTLQVGELRLGIRSNSSELLDRLEAYFEPFVSRDGDTEIEIHAIERDVADLGLDFLDWPREPGKSGRKDAYLDVTGGRILRKVRTGMVFLQSESHRLAAGPCLRHLNQVVNFVNSQYMNWLQLRDWSICHAAGIVLRGRCLAIAGFSGGGKSTLMLHLMADTLGRYLTNDRLFVRRGSTEVTAAGIAKWPRVNPGTIVHNERLHPLLPPHDLDRWSRLPSEELWQIEQKFDVEIEPIFGPDRIAIRAPLGAILVLSWRRDSTSPTRIQPVELGDRRDLLEGAVMKSPGPFFQDQKGRMLRERTPLDPEPYLEALRDVPVFEATGRIDFSSVDPDRAAEMVRP